MTKIIIRLVAVLVLAGPSSWASARSPVDPLQIQIGGKRPTPAPAVYFVAPGSLVVVVHIPSPAPDRLEMAFRCATRGRESGDNPAKIGIRGERGAYQFRYVTWRQYSRLPFRAAHTAAAELVAHEHFAWIARGLNRRGLAVTPYNLAGAWNAGLDAWVNGRAGPDAREYAAAVAALTQAYLRGQT
jgi:hypothetical protein